MPLYVYGCGPCGNFEAYGSHADDFAPCPTCHKPARRRPYSSVPYLKGDTVPSAQIPDPAYKLEKQKRELASDGWTTERSSELIKKNTMTDVQGRKKLNVAAMNREGQ